MSASEAGVEAYLGYLGSLRESGAEYFLEGGQAVNFWAEYIDSLSQASPLSPMRPFTSKDCDIWVSSRTWKTLKRNPAIRPGDSPADGQLGILTLSKEPPRVVDVLSSVYGIDVKEYPRLLERALDDGTVKVIDPIHLFLSKCHCLLNLPQADRQDGRHVLMMALIIPEYLSLLIADVETEALSERALLKEIKLVKKIASTAICRRAIAKVGSGTVALIPWDRLTSSRSELLAKFAQSQRSA
jgi:hypothetical protein